MIEGTIEIDFADLTTYTVTVDRPAAVLSVPGDLWSLTIDLPTLVDLYGPVTSLTYTATVVPVPAALWCLAGALAWLWLRNRA